MDEKRLPLEERGEGHRFFTILVALAGGRPVRSGARCRLYCDILSLTAGDHPDCSERGRGALFPSHN